MTERVPAEVFPPGEYIREELEARGWSQADLAEIMGTSAKTISDLIAAKCSVTPETAQGLGNAFGTDSQLWMNLDASYRLWRLRPNEDVARRARLYTIGPLKEMTRRHWIEYSENLDLLETRLMKFYGIRSLEETPAFAHAARTSAVDQPTTPAQVAWLCRAKSMARVLPAGTFSDSSLKVAIQNLRALMAAAESTRSVARVLADSGIRLVLVEGLAGTKKLDGATFWLDKSPVIALSLRFDRIDWFWFTLLHEVDHVAHGEGSFDLDLVGSEARPSDSKAPNERRADTFAAETALPKEKLDSFIARVDPLYSKAKIMNLAAAMNVHPGIVVGQLQHRKAISYAHSRDLLVKVRSHLLDSSLTDGWGHQPPVQG